MKERLEKIEQMGKITVFRRTWVTTKGVERTSFQVRIRETETKSYFRKHLSATNKNDALEEAIELFGQSQTALKKGNRISEDRKGLPHFIKKYLEYRKQDERDGNISSKRYAVIEHHLKSLTRFWVEHNKQKLDNLIDRYQREFKFWRGESISSITGRKLSASFKDNELSTHRSFFGWCKDQGFCERVVKVKGYANLKPNKPFPQKNYARLLKVIEKSINTAPTLRGRFNYRIYYHQILLMNTIGCRVVELKNLQWSDLRHNKKEDYYTLYLHGKNKERTIVLPPDSRDYLLRLKEVVCAKQDWWSEEKYPFIFSLWKSGVMSHFNQQLKAEWFTASGVEASEYQLVSFRHAFITRKLNEGVNSLELAKFCGTSQLMIEKTYAGLVSKDVYDLVFANIPQRRYSQPRRNPIFLSDEKITSDKESSS